MKKLVILISFVVIVILGYHFFTTSSRDYEINYNVNQYEIIEKYDKSKEYYRFDITKEDIKFEYISNMKYMAKRKLIKDIEVKEMDSTICIKPISDDEQFDFICKKNEEYVDKYLGGLEETKSSSKMNRVANVDIYDNTHEYVIWNNKGFTSLSNNKQYNFLKKESYDNLLTYKYKDNIIIADYDQSRNFDKFYIYDNKSKSVDTWQFDDKISFDAYFMGDVEDKIYLFDKKNKIQKSLNVAKKRIEVTSDKNGAFFYDKAETHKDIDTLTYNEMVFIKENKYNFFLENDKLYMKMYDGNQKVRLSDEKIDAIVDIIDDEVFYLVDEKLYSYKVNRGNKLLLVNFEWNFTYLNKIFIFD